MKTVYAGEWVWVRPLMNKRFPTDGLCCLCGRGSCAPGWLSIDSGKFRCRRCFDAEAEHWRLLLRGSPPKPEAARRATVEAGGTVVATLKKLHRVEIDADLLDWARATGRLVRIDRQTDWGNPFKIPRDGDRETVIAKFRAHLAARPDLQRRLPELRGKVLACWCYPKACHGEELIEAVERLPP
jgi:hypothetical protein